MKRFAIICTGIVVMSVLLAVVLPYLFTLRAQPDVRGTVNVLPVGDSLRLRALKSRQYGNWLTGGTFTVFSDEFPYSLLYRWSARPPTQSSRIGEATVDQRGLVTGVKPGIVIIEATVFGRSGTHELRILPKVVEFGATPAQLNLRVGERVPLTFTLKLEGDVRERWSPDINFPAPDERMTGRNSRSDIIEVDALERVPLANEWHYEVTGKHAGTTTLYLSINTRQVAVPVAVTAGVPNAQ
jgi:hypothetical protein